MLQRILIGVFALLMLALGWILADYRRLQSSQNSATIRALHPEPPLPRKHPAVEIAPWPYDRPVFSRVLTIVLENQDAANVAKDPYFAEIARKGKLFTNFHALYHPSYPNYLAMIGGDAFGVTSDTQTYVEAPCIADLLEARGLTWANFAEDYPGPQRLGLPYLESDGPALYARKHVPFLSFVSVLSPQRSRNVRRPPASDRLPTELATYTMYSPNLVNDGHNPGGALGLSASSAWLKTFLEPLLNDAAVMDNTLIIITYDECESSADETNAIYTLFLGNMLRDHAPDGRYFNHLDMLRTIEDNFQLGRLGGRARDDAPWATAITGIWREPK